MSGRIRRTAGDNQNPARQQVIEQLTLNDPVAGRTEWVPAAKGGANFRTRRLIQVSPGRVEFRPTLTGRLIPLFFLLIGLGAPAIIVYGLVNEFAAGPLIVLPLVTGCLFAGLGGTLYWFMTRRVAFDQGDGCFWMGGSIPRSAADAEHRKNSVPLAHIHAIQVISKSLEDSDDGSLYDSYEINVVVNDGTRINVVDHSDLVCIRQDARQLAQFLNVPFWDVV